MSKDYWAQKYHHHEKFEKAEKDIDGDEDVLVLCLLTSECKKESKNKKVLFVEDVKQPSESCMMCTIDGDTFFLFTKNTQIGDSSASCNGNTGIYDITDINESIQGSSSITTTTKKGMFQVKVCQVDGTEQVHTLWPVKFCPKASANIFSLMCELSQGNKIANDHHNNIMVNTPTGNIILDCQIKTHNGWVAGVNFLHEANNKRGVLNTALSKRTTTFTLSRSSI